jgi:N-acyl-phosphatidylethanolamine-hydrolysing phospholipase D
MLRPGSLEAGLPRIVRPAAPADDVRITWVGHATFLVQIAGLNILTDPVWSERASPVQWAGPRRLMPPGVAFDALPPIDAVLLSHDHYDHLDSGTIRRIARKHANAQWISPLGYARWLRRRGVKRVEEMDWWQATTIDSPRVALRITAYPVQHWTRRNFFDTNRRLWCSYGIDAGEGARVYFAGDSGWCDAFREIGRNAGAFDAALLPIGAYEPRWFMKPAHMNPEEAVQAWKDLGGRGRFVPMHWGTFILTDEPVLEPLARLRSAWQAAGQDLRDLSILRQGDTLEFHRNGESVRE